MAAVLAKVAPSLVEAAPRPSARRKRTDDRVTLAFVSAYLSDHSIGKMLAEVLFFLARDARLRVLAFHVFNGKVAPDDHVRAFLARHLGADGTVALPEALDAARRAVVARDVDVLVYPDVGMEMNSYFLAFARLARVQCVWWGHPVTTGLPSVDYFLGLDTEVDGAALTDYSEQLVRLSHVNTAPFQAQRLEATVPRSDLFAAEGDPGGAVYVVLGAGHGRFNVASTWVVSKQLSRKQASAL